MTFRAPSNGLHASKEGVSAVPRRAALLMFFALSLLGGPAAPGASAQVGQDILIYSENFDGVTAPGLPSGWTTSTAGAGVPFATVAGSTETAPNAVQATMPAGGGSSTLTSPPILINQPGAVLSFRHRFNAEMGWDGGRIDIVDTQFPLSPFYSTFVANGYNSKFRGAANPLNELASWSGESDGYIETRIALPDPGHNYTIQISWTAAHDGAVAEDGRWLIDSVAVVGTFTATSAGAIGIPGSGPASPYPSEVTVSGRYGAVQQVVVRLHDFSHSSPDDVDLMLVAPNGRKVILMSDVGGGNPVSNLTLTFDDAAANYLPDEGALATGTYKPTDYGAERDNWPAPAPSDRTFGSTLSTFFGGYPNGTYKLFLVDDSGNNVGSVGGWSIALRTSQNICWMSFNVVPMAYTAAGGSGTVYVTTQPGCSWSLVYHSPGVITLTSPPSGTGSGSVNFTVAPNTTGAFRTGSLNFQSPTQQTGTHVQQSPN